MNALLYDLRYALRQLRRSPGVTAVAVLTLALGIGANTGIFTLVNAVLLKSLPVEKPEQLFLVQRDDGDASPPYTARFSYPMFQEELSAMPRGAELAATSGPGRFYASFGGAQPEMATGQLVSGTYFPVIGTRAARGRLLNANDDRVLGGSAVAVISYGCWERRFGRDPNVIGSKFTVNGMPFEIVGVTSRGFFGAEIGVAPEFWLPTAMQAEVRYQQHYSQDTNAKTDAPWRLQPDIRWLQFIIRVNDAKLVTQLPAALNQVFRSSLEQAAAALKNAEGRAALLRVRLDLRPGAQGLPTLRESFSQPLLALMAMVGVILLIACANLANLLFARAAVREREVAIRLSIGASRGRLIRQLLLECLLLSASGTIAGSAVAYWLSGNLPKWLTSEEGASIPLRVAPDTHVLFFSTTVAVLAAIVFGLAPAVQSTRVQPIQALKSGGRTGPAGSTSRWSVKETLVSVQVALSLVLLIMAGLFVETLRNFSTFDPGFDRDHLVTVGLDTHLAGYSPARLSTLYGRLIERVEALPGVRSASLLSCEIAMGCGDASDIFLPGVPHSHETDAQERRVSHEFFQTTGIPLLEGRSFADFDTGHSPPVVVVNEAFVRQFLRGKNPIGQYYGYDAENPYRFQIVGVVKDSRVNDVRESVPPTIYHSLSQDVTDVESLNVRTWANPTQLVTAIRETVRSVDPNLAMGASMTISEVVSNSLSLYRVIARLATMFGTLALGLACLGLYGILSYTVARRTAELGIRLALGASRTALLWLVLRHVLALVGAGLFAGLTLSALSVHALKAMLFGLSPYDPATLVGAALVLVLVAMAAGLKPAWRAAHVNPSEALRME
jgi:predicted permease